MKYCKEELKIIPKRLMAFNGRHFFKQKNESNKSKPNYKGNRDIPQEYHNHDHMHSPSSRNIHTKDTGLHHHHNNSPIDDSIGRIKHLVIGYTYYTNSNELNAFNKVYSDLVIKLSRTGEWSDKAKVSKDDALKLSSIAPTEKALKNLIKVNGAIKTLAEFTGDYMRKDDSLNILGNSLSTQIWIQDDIIPVRDENNKIILYGRLATGISNSQDNCPASALSNAIQCEHEMVLDQQLAGGNMLFIGPYILIGHNSLANPKTAANPEGGYCTEDKLKENLSCLFKEPKVIIIGNQENERITDSYKNIIRDTTDDIAWLNKDGNNSQPVFHLDLFITPAGLSQDKKYRIVIGDPITLLDRDDTELLKKGGLFDKTRSAINKIANQLSQHHDIEVSRIPLPLSWVDLVDENRKETKRLWFFASYNNSLVQYTGQESEDNYVLLPKYGNSYSMEKSGYTIKVKKDGKDEEIKVRAGDWSELKEFETQARKHWNHLGFKVVFLTDYLPMIIQRGALRCMIKVIDREILKPDSGVYL